jgi:hypothetical protein
MDDKSPRTGPSAEPASKVPRDIDIDAVERDYRTGAFTDRELGKKYGCSHTYIQKLAKRKMWQKDLRRAVEMATQAHVAELECLQTKHATAAAKVRKQIEQVLPATAEVVTALAEINSQVVMRHRHELRVARSEVMALWAELTGAREGAALAGRIAASGVLVTALTRLHERENKAYGITDEDSNPRDERKSLPIVFVDPKPRPAND